MRELLADMLQEWQRLQERIHAIDCELVAEAQQCEACTRLREVPGIGAQTATALVASIRDGRAFESGRDLAAWLGLTPKENSTGGKQRLGRISKHGNRYVRTLLVHCARAGLDRLAKRGDGLGQWLRRMLAEKKPSAVIVALAARRARIAWALLTSGQRFGQQQPQAAS